MTTWTAEDAANLLDPPLTIEEVRALIRATRLTPVGTRRTGRRGRPAEIYDSDTLLRAHAAVVPFLVEKEGPATPDQTANSRVY